MGMVSSNLNEEGISIKTSPEGRRLTEPSMRAFCSLRVSQYADRAKINDSKKSAEILRQLLK